MACLKEATGQGFFIRFLQQFSPLRAASQPRTVGVQRTHVPAPSLPAAFIFRAELAISSLPHLFPCAQHRGRRLSTPIASTAFARSQAAGSLLGAAARGRWAAGTTKLEGREPAAHPSGELCGKPTVEAPKGRHPPPWQKAQGENRGRGIGHPETSTPSTPALAASLALHSRGSIRGGG